MKSIIEQSSSLGKAIEKAWQRANQPTEFTVKIFQNAERGFLGFSSKPAKIGLFFQNTTPVQKKSTHQATTKKQSSDKQLSKPIAKKKHFSGKNIDPIVRPWIEKTITYMELKNNPFSIKTLRNRLIITFEKPFFENQKRMKRLFASLSSLTLVMLRNHLQSDLRDIKVIIKHK